MQDIGERLRICREAIGKSQVDNARAANITPSAYNQFEKGRIRPALDTALSLCEVYGLSLDYIYRGIDIGFRPDFAKLLSAMEKMSAGKRVGREGRWLKGR